MVSKAANTAEVTETREEAAEAPLLDTLAAAIKKMLARDKLTPAPGDLTAVLVSGRFEVQKDQITGTWPIPRKFIESLVSGKVQ